MSKNRKPTGGGHIFPVAYAKAGLIRTPFPFHVEWNKRVNACETIEELNKLAEL